MNIIGARLLNSEFGFERGWKFDNCTFLQQLHIDSQENLDELHRLVDRELELEQELIRGNML